MFYRYYHPDYSIYPISDYLPQPAGIIIYDHNEQALGAHAILIQRVGKDPTGFIVSGEKTPSSRNVKGYSPISREGMIFTTRTMTAASHGEEILKQALQEMVN